jgi:hypothetical protein
MRPETKVRCVRLLLDLYIALVVTLLFVLDKTCM